MLLWLLIVFQLILACHGYVEIEGKVVNGETATNFIPYQASIRVSVRDFTRFGRGHTCGGVLIKSRTVVTAAHCLMNGERLRTPFDIHIVLGSLNRYKRIQETLIEHVERVTVHPEYRRYESFAHDIGVLRRSVHFSDIIHSIPLIDYPIQTATECKVSGWGALEWQGIMPDDLQKANVSIVDRDFCNNSYSGIITLGMVCANGLTKSGKVIDVCQGDSGGPLECNGLLVGLASFGAQCGASLNHPGVFVDIYFYRNWIIDNWNGVTMQKSQKTSILVFTLFINLIWKLFEI